MRVYIWNIETCFNISAGCHESVEAERSLIRLLFVPILIIRIAFTNTTTCSHTFATSSTSERD